MSIDLASELNTQTKTVWINSRTVVLLLLAGWLVAGNPTAALADGGTVRRSIHQGKFQITVFTSPTPPRAGSIDVSVLVQDATTGEPCSDARVCVHATPHGQDDQTITRLATRDTATNKLLTAALLDLPGAGIWDIRVCVEDQRECTEVGFDLEVGEPLPGWFLLAEWIAWPAVAIGLYVGHRLLVRRKKRSLNIDVPDKKRFPAKRASKIRHF